MARAEEYIAEAIELLEQRDLFKDATLNDATLHTTGECSVVPLIEDQQETKIYTVELVE